MLNSGHINFIELCILFSCSVHFISVNCTTWTKHISRNETRYKRQTECAKDLVPCKSGECLNENNVCDGKEDCKDGSDESDCLGIPCTGPNLFRCDYGGCISKFLKCDGKTDCKDNSDESKCSDNNLCSLEKFHCKSGECIEDAYLCDGSTECKDGSDETEEACNDLTCPGNTYRCNYGGCISRIKECDGNEDCRDGSDEAKCKKPPVTPSTPTPTPKPTPTPTPTSISKPTSGSCIMPNNPAHGYFRVGEVSQQPGTHVPQFNAIILNCTYKYKPSPPNNGISVCLNGEWSPPPPTCALSCNSVESTKTTFVQCKFKKIPLDDCKNPVEGVEASISCAALHEEPGLLRYPFRKCKDGSWDNAFPQCYPICGEKRPSGVTQIINGETVKRGDYPWHVGIFHALTKANICGGSILNDHVVLSAAHCFSDLSNGRKHPKENYMVAAGKYFRDYDDIRDTEVQYSAVDDIFFPPRYKGEISQYEADIAVVILSTNLIYTSSVKPVCVDWSNNFENQQISGNKHGVVVGWGQTVEGAEPSKVLKELSMPVIPYEQCYEQVPKDFRRFLTYDKVCAGFLSQQQSTCQGDSGGGLSFPYLDDRYYIRGIVSTSPATTERFCDSNQYGTYTLVSKYVDFIRQLL